MVNLDELFALYKKGVPRVKLNRTFYFDESNNIRKGVIGPLKDNNNDLENLYFTLGGIATRKPLDFNALLNYIGARQVPNDAKFSFFTFKHNRFVEAIAQPRLRKLFEYLNKEDIIIHFAVEHYFHYALVDILDSLIEERDIFQETALNFYKRFQSDMTRVLYDDFASLHKILVDYEFPNIPNGKASGFINEILDLYTTNLDNYDMDDYNNFSKELLRQLIKRKKDKTNLLFLEDNEPFVISGLQTQIYLTRMYNFEDKKIFDNECSIESELEKIDAEYESKLDVKFCDSKEVREIQLCDAVSGFVGRLYNFLSKTDEENILKFVLDLNVESESFKTLKAFFDLMSKSDNESPCCFMKTNPLFIDERFDLLYRATEHKSLENKAG